MDVKEFIRQSSARGYVAELMVFRHLTEHGYVVSQPVAYSPYDVVAEVPKTHKMLRIQVKRAYQRCDRLDVHTYVHVGVYDEDAFDYLAVVIPDEDTILYFPWSSQWRGNDQQITDDMRTYTELPE